MQKTGEAFDVAAQMTAKLADQIPFEVIHLSIIPLSMHGCSCLSSRFDSGGGAGLQKMWDEKAAEQTRLHSQRTRSQ